MNNADTINLLVIYEDDLSFCVLEKLLKGTNRPFSIVRKLSHNGRGYIQKRINSFNEASKIIPCLVLVDLDRDECAPTLKRQWLSQPEHPNFLFRVAVHEVESWLLADSTNLSTFFGISRNLFPIDVENIENPKRELINLARKSHKRIIVEDIVPKIGSTATQGRNYNSRLIQFVYESWDIPSAQKKSDSLIRTFEHLKTFVPL